MITLLKRVKARLQDQIEYIRKSDFLIVVDEDIFKDGFKKYFIGIKDGGGDIGVRTSDAGTDWDILIDVVIWVRLHKSEATIIGDDSSPDNKGVFTIMADVFTTLDNYYLPNTAGVEYVETAESQGWAPSEIFGDEDTSYIQKLKTTMRYVINKT